MTDEVDPYFVPTRCSKGRELASQHKLIIHEASNSVSNNTSKSNDHDKTGPPLEELDMKQARFQVYKFAQSGLPNAARQSSQFDLALKLGAVPKKNPSVNYKTLKEELLKKRKEQEEKAQLYNLGKAHRPVRFGNKKRAHPKADINRKRKIGSAILAKYGKATKRK